MKRSNLELVHCDAYDLIESFSRREVFATVDIILLAPPWGGIDYMKKKRSYGRDEFGPSKDAVEENKEKAKEGDNLSGHEVEEEEKEDGSKDVTFDLRLHMSSGDGIDLLQKVSVLSANIVYLLPRNTNLQQIEEMRDLIQRPCRVEKILLRKKLKMIVVYFGEMFRGKKDTMWLPSLSE